MLASHPKNPAVVFDWYGVAPCIQYEFGAELTTLGMVPIPVAKRNESQSRRKFLTMPLSLLRIKASIFRRFA
jgi:hypothetical protein